MLTELQIKVWESSALPFNWFERQTPENDERLESDVKALISRVIKGGDAALIDFTEKFDRARLEANDLQVTPKETEDAYKAVGKEQVAALKFIKDKVTAFEKLALKQVGFVTSGEDITVQCVLRPIESVGSARQGSGSSQNRGVLTAQR